MAPCGAPYLDGFISLLDLLLQSLNVLLQVCDDPIQLGNLTLRFLYVLLVSFYLFLQ